MLRRCSKLLFSTGLAVGLLSWVGLCVLQPAQAAGSLQRVSGPNRLGTAIETSRQLFPVADSAEGVILARQDTFPDALAASSLAGIVRAPILLNAPGTGLDPLVHGEIDRLLTPGKPVFIIGGAAALSASIDAELGGVYAVERLAGADRYETAIKIKERGDAARGFTVAAALFARGDSYADALSGSSYAAFSGTPIVLVQRDAVPASVLPALTADLASPYILGGTAAVSDAVLAHIETSTASPATRISGADRYATSAAISQYFFANPLAVMFATGQNFPDALAGGVLAGLTVLSPSGLPILLVQKESVPQAIEGYLAAHKSTIDDATSGYIMGGESAVTLETELLLEGQL